LQESNKRPAELGGSAGPSLKYAEYAVTLSRRKDATMARMS
jgi:hypothetical protein